METSTPPERTVTLVCTTDRLNLNQVEYFQKLLRPWVTQQNMNIIFDLRHVRFIDCCAVGCLVSLNQIARKNDSLLSLCNLTGYVKILSDTLKLPDIINIQKPHSPITCSKQTEIYHMNRHNVKRIQLF